MENIINQLYNQITDKVDKQLYIQFIKRYYNPVNHQTYQTYHLQLRVPLRNQLDNQLYNQLDDQLRTRLSKF